jgi:hypothetical protein
MAIDKTYRCDLCNDMHSPDDGKLVGIYWTTRQSIEVRSVRSVEHHLCRGCVEAIAAIRSTTAYSSVT